MSFILKALYFLITLSFCLEARGNVHVIDAGGNTVQLSLPATRIVSLAPNLTEILCEINAGQQIIARDRYSDFPESILRVPIVADYYKMNIEHILSLKPDLVVVEQSSFLKKDISQLKCLGIAVYINKTSNLASITKTMLDLGKLSGHGAYSINKARMFKTDIDKLTQQAPLNKKVPVFYELWDKPLLTVNNSALIGEIISRCGGTNIFGNLYNLNPNITVEAVINKHPKVIIVSSPKYKLTWLPLKQTKVIYIPPDLIQRTGPRLLSGMKQICHSLK